MRVFHCSWALALLLTALPAGQQPAAPTGYTIFVRGTPIGREDITIETGPTGPTVISTGRLSAPLNVVLRRAELKYRPDWTPERIFLDISPNGGDATLRTSFANGSATSEMTQQGQTSSVTHAVSAQAVALPNNVFAAYVALAQRLTTATAGTAVRAYIVPNAEVGITVDTINAERVQIGATFVNVRRYDLTVANPDGDLGVSITADDRGSLIRVGIPAAGLDVVRADLAASTSRVQIYSNSGDEPVIIPAVGFNLGATLTRPGAPPSPPRGAGRLAAVILIGGAAVYDRDGVIAGVPILGQLAGAAADAGFLAVRYDKRGFGQSGGRSESATLQDHGEDVRAIVKWLQSREDVDDKRIAVIGHGEGAWVAIQAAARENKIGAVVSLAGPGTTGAELILEQQQMALDALKLTPTERDQRVALQKQIQNAVLTGRGWEGISAEMRQDADTPWLQSFLAFTPAKVVDDVRQPILFVHGEIDRQIPVTHLTQLSELARQGRSRSVEVVTVRGVNHLLLPAITGEVGEYAALTDRSVSADVRSTVTGWLTKTFAAIE